MWGDVSLWSWFAFPWGLMWCWVFFLVLFGHQHFLLGNLCVQVFCLFLLAEGFFVFLMLSCMGCLYILYVNLFLCFSCSVMSDSLWPHGLQHARVTCPSPSPGVSSNSYSLCQWCCLTISFFDAPFSSYPQFFPASGSFPMSWVFASGGQSIGTSASISALPMKDRKSVV